MTLNKLFFRNQPHQLELNIARDYELDRNRSKGGRSFYFFDFDDNIAVLATTIYIFHKETGKEIGLTSREFAEISASIGHTGAFKDYRINFDDDIGSFRNFRDKDHHLVEKWFGKKQAFINDLMLALGLPDHDWKGPAWNCFYHAVYNQRPTSLITARGHSPETLKEGFRKMIQAGHLPHEPNYLSIYPINHPETRKVLESRPEQSVAELKQKAIRNSVETAFSQYGYTPFHRFGMSDDDPKNLELIIEEMSRLKKDYPENSFFVFDTQKGRMLKREIFTDHTEDQPVAGPKQVNLF